MFLTLDHIESLRYRVVVACQGSPVSGQRITKSTDAIHLCEGLKELGPLWGDGYGETVSYGFRPEQNLLERFLLVIHFDPLRVRVIYPTQAESQTELALPARFSAVSDFLRRGGYHDSEGVKVSGEDPGIQKAIKSGIEKIIRQELAKNQPVLRERVIERATDVFVSRHFAISTGFLELMLDPALRQYADTIPYDESIVIDCGHIDSRDYIPMEEDVRTVEHAVLLRSYLLSQGHEKVKLGFLINDIYLQEEGKDGKKAVKQMRKQSKREGVPDLVRRIYQGVADGWGFTLYEWKNSVVCMLEGSLNGEIREDIKKYEKGNSPFTAELDRYGEKGYILRFEEEGRIVERLIVSENGGPRCPFQAAKQNARYERLGFDNVIYLRSQQWRTGTVCGARIAPRLYGTNINVSAFFYAEDEGNIAISDIRHFDTSPKGSQKSS